MYSSFNPKLKIDKAAYDLYMVYGFAFVHQIKNSSNKNKCITGLTAHRKLSQIKKAMDSLPNHHANSVLLYNELKALGKKPFYVPNGVNEKLFHPIAPLYYNRPYLRIGHVGKKSPQKNQASFIEPMLKSIDMEFVPHYNDYSDKIPHEQMVHKYQEFDLFIAASTEDGTPNGMLEAMACGRPVIINRIGNAPELIKDGYNGFLVEMKQQDYIEKIRWCKKNPAAVIEMGKNARKSIIEGGWTWEMMSRNYLYMWDRILGIQRDHSLYENPALHHIEGYI